MASSRSERRSLLGFNRACNNIIQDVVRLLNSDQRNDDYIQPALARLQSLSQNIHRMSRRFPECAQLLQLVQSIMQDIQELKRASRTIAYQTGTSRSGNPGRPVLTISKEQLEYLIELKFNCGQIAKMLNVSRSTIIRRIRYFQLNTRCYSSITDEDLDDIIRQVGEENPHLGYRSVQAHLQCMGHDCQERRVRESLVRVDPAAVAMRWSDTIQRRSYQVRGPNSLWHIDGNHKLIRYKFVIHGGIDGFSRLVVYLNVSTNNKAETVLGSFLSATQKYGIPSRVRSDKGIENVHIATFMNMYRGDGRGSMIQGRSVHNQRIERLWVDVYQGCTNVYFDLFNFLEDRGILDIHNEVHMWALHFVFKPRIQRSLNHFAEQWNNHKLSTELGKTPKQVFVEGALLNVQSDDAGACDLFHGIGEPINLSDGTTGNEGEAAENNNEEETDRNIESDSGENDISVGETNCPLSDSDFCVLKGEIDPLSDEAERLGISHFLKTLEFVRSHTNQ